MQQFDAAIPGWPLELFRDNPRTPMSRGSGESSGLDAQMTHNAWIVPLPRE
jgi:hypothetical protein